MNLGARCWLSLLLLLFAAGSAEAHLGYENETEVRIHAERIRVVARTSYKFAATILGDRAPAAFDAGGQEAAKPLLVEAAPGLFDFNAGGVAMKATSADCVFEPHDRVAFVLNYERPQAWPLVITARFFPRLASLESGSIQVFDQTDKPFGREVQPIASKRITSDSPTLKLDSLDRRVATAPVPVAPMAEARKEPSSWAAWWPVALIFLFLPLGYWRWRSTRR